MTSATFARSLMLVLLVGAMSVSAALPETQILPLRQLYMGRYASASSRTYVSVPAGMVQLVMEQRIGGAWTRILVQDVTFAPRERVKSVFVTLPPKVSRSQLRIVGRRTALPVMLTPAAPVYERFEMVDEVYPVLIHTVLPGGVLRMNGILAGNAQSSVVANPAPAQTPAAVEADIWKIAGDRLFFFNHYRGLQVFDLSEPSTPARLGGLRLPARGDQIYVLDEAATTVALVAEPLRYEGAAELYIARLNRNVPELVATLPLQGRIIDSRLIGDRLYLLSHTHSPPVHQITLSPFQSHCTLLTVDLSNPTAPVMAEPLHLGPSNISQLQACGRYLLIATRADKPLMHVIDLEDGKGAPALLKTVTLKAPVQDKFKMGVVNGAAVAVTSAWFNGPQETWVETFAIDGPDTAPLAQLELEGARNESLFGTRFDGERLYVVTLLVRLAWDPLFIVDLANPAAPVVRAALEIPGWSTYLEPHGDRIVAVGREGNQVAVSLFDVADAEAPTLAARLLLGDSASWSEANSNEKAVEYYSETGTLLVPFNGRDGRTAIQVVQVGRDSLTAGITIPHDGTARRGAAVGGHLVSISGSELRVVDAAAASAEPVAEVSLAWRVDRALIFGDCLVQIDDGSGWGFDGDSTGPRCLVRITRQADPDALLDELDLGRGRIVGAAHRANRLFLAQWCPDYGQNAATLRTWVLDLTKPLQAKLASTAEHQLSDTSGSDVALDRVEALWPTAGTLVWHLPVSQNRMQYIVRPDITVPWSQPITSLPGIGGIISIGGNGLQASANVLAPQPSKSHLAVLLCPVKIVANTAAASPVIRLSSDEPVRGNSRSLAHAGAVYLSYDAMGPYEREKEGYTSKRRIRSWLQAVDFTSTEPQPAPPVSIPGELVDLAQGKAQGQLLLFTRAGERGAFTMDLHASSFTGSAAILLRTQELSANIFGAFASLEAQSLYFAVQGPAPGVAGFRFDSSTQTFSEVAHWPMTVTPGVLKALPKLLLASSYENLDTARIAASGALTPAAAFDTPPQLNLRVDRLTEGAKGVFIPAQDYGVEFLSWKELEGK